MLWIVNILVSLSFYDDFHVSGILSLSSSMLRRRWGWLWRASITRADWAVNLYTAGQNRFWGRGRAAGKRTVGGAAAGTRTEVREEVTTLASSLRGWRDRRPPAQPRALCPAPPTPSLCLGGAVQHSCHTHHSCHSCHIRRPTYRLSQTKWHIYLTTLQINKYLTWTLKSIEWHFVSCYWRMPTGLLDKIHRSCCYVQVQAVQRLRYTLWQSRKIQKMGLKDQIWQISQVVSWANNNLCLYLLLTYWVSKLFIL